MAVFDNNTSLPTSLARAEDADGNVRRHCLAHTALTANKAYAMVPGASGFTTAAVTAATASTTGTIIRIIVPDQAVASGASFWGITGGYVAAVDVGTSIDASSNKYVEWVAGGTIAIEAANNKASVFGICTDADNDDNHDMILFDREIVTATS